jgi:hypothetical protein
MSTQRNLATHRLPKSHAHRAPQWPRHLATEPSLALATPLASSPPSTCRQHRAQCQLKQPSKHQKTCFFYTPTLPPRHGFVTHRRTHLRAYSLQGCAHTCAPIHYKGVHACAPVHYIGAHQCAPVCFTGVPLCMHFHHTGAPRCTPVQPIDVHGCAPVQLTGALFENALNPLYRAPMHVYLVGRCARMHTYHWITRAYGAHTP